MDNVSPIILFVYNRPEHTRSTLRALVENDLASKSELYIYSDGAKDDSAVDQVAAVRRSISELSGFKSITIIERTKNWGLAANIIDGVTSVVRDYGKVIVLEDDILCSPHFLHYMNKALDVYKDSDKVMHISGYMFPIDGEGLDESFFLQLASCWGWGTWDRAWASFKKDPQLLIQNFSTTEISRFNMNGTYDFWSQVEQNYRGEINTWAVFWYASVFIDNGLCLHPAISMVENIGHDASGQHCGRGVEFSIILAKKEISYFEPDLCLNEAAQKKTREFFSRLKPQLVYRAYRFLTHKLHSLIASK